MSNIKILDSIYKIRSLNTKEQLAGENVMRNCLEVKQGEKVLVITDALKEKVEAPVFFETAKLFTNQVEMVVMQPTGQDGIEPSQKVAKMMLVSNVILAPTTYSISHTKATFKARKNKARIASMPGITLDTILRTLTVDFIETDVLSTKIANLLTKAKLAILTSPSGTDLVMKLTGRQAIADLFKINNPLGDFGNLPAGEAFLAPVEGKSNGILVFEDCYGKSRLNQPVAFKVKDGLVIKALSKAREAKKIEAMLNQVGPKARNIAELGIGTNKLAKPGKGILEVEKIYGTVHIALGNNKYFGGEVDVPYHVDGLIVKPTLKLNNQIIIREGQFYLH